MKIATLTVCALALSTSFALAQPSQGQAGAATGPTSNSATSSPGMNNDGMNNGSGMQGGATTGMNSGGGSGMTNSGGANGTSSSMPRTTTGPAGAASKDGSPAR